MGRLLKCSGCGCVFSVSERKLQEIKESEFGAARHLACPECNLWGWARIKRIQGQGFIVIEEFGLEITLTNEGINGKIERIKEVA